MKILFCTNSFENTLNGPAIFARLILEINQMNNEHEVRVLTEDISVQSDHVYKLNIQVPRLQRLKSQFIRIREYHNQALEIRKEFPFDVMVHNNSFLGLKSAQAGLFPTIGMINDDNNIRKIPFTSAKKWLKRKVWGKLEANSTKYHKAIITNSNFMKSKLLEHYKLSEKKLALLYKAVDFEKLPYQKRSLTGSIVKVLFVKADFERGGLYELASALGQITTTKFQLTIIGPAQSLEHQIKSNLQSSSNVIIDFKGEQANDVVNQELYSHDIFCVPSRHEALGIANIEALATGIPVISTNTGGIPEVMDDGKCGWLAQPENVSFLAEVIKSCLDNSDQRIMKSEYGREYVLSTFGTKRLLNQFIDISLSVC